MPSKQTILNGRVGALWCVLAGVLALAAAPANAEWVDGYWVYPYKNFRNSTYNARPFSASQKSLSFSDTKISGLATMQKGVAIGSTRFANGQPSWAYRWIALWHCEIAGVKRVPGGHVDFVHIVGGGHRQDVPTTVLLQDLYLHDGDGIPVLIQDGTFDKITFKDIRIRNTTVGLQVATLNAGNVGQIVVDHCTYTTLMIQGPPGTVKEVFVKNSPGLKVWDWPTNKGKTGCRITYLN